MSIWLLEMMEMFHSHMSYLLALELWLMQTFTFVNIYLIYI